MPLVFFCHYEDHDKIGCMCSSVFVCTAAALMYTLLLRSTAPLETTNSPSNPAVAKQSQSHKQTLPGCAMHQQEDIAEIHKTLCVGQADVEEEEEEEGQEQQQAAPGGADVDAHQDQQQQGQEQGQAMDEDVEMEDAAAAGGELEAELTLTSLAVFHLPIVSLARAWYAFPC